MRLRSFTTLVSAIVVCELAGIIGSLFTTPAIESGWYTTLLRPALAPPSWVFGPVWVLLYALMGVSVWLVWRSKSAAPRARRAALSIFALQLIANACWSIIFFGLRAIGGACVEIAFLWLAIVATIIAFSKISKAAAWLLAPYLLWVSFAVYLNYMIWALN